MAISLSKATTGTGVGGRPQGRLRRWSASPHALLFLLLLCLYAYTPPRWQDWNQNSRFDLTLALVEQRTVQIDAYVANTGDYAAFDGHFYSDKAPGLSLAAVPVYAVTRALRPFGLGALTRRLEANTTLVATLRPGGAGISAERIDFAVALYLATLICVALPGAITGVLIAQTTERMWGCRTAGLISALAFGLATPIFTYAQAFYGHVPAAACVMGAFAALVMRRGQHVSNGRLALVGFLLGCAVVLEYTAAIAALPIALWAVALAPKRAVAFGALGASAPLALLMVYDLAAFRTILPIGYEHSALWQPAHSQGFLSITYPRWEAIRGLTSSPFRGLFFVSPVLLLAIPGCWIALRTAGQRLPATVAIVGCVGLFLLIASSAMWWGGFAVGPRYLVPALPLMAIPLGATLAWINARRGWLRLGGLVGVCGLAALSFCVVWGLTFAGQGYPPDTIRTPLTEYAWPALLSGDVARNLGIAAGLRGVVGLVPPLLVVASGCALLATMVLFPAKETA